MLFILIMGVFQFLNILKFEAEAVFEKPVSIDYDTNIVRNEINTKHYYEFSTNYPKVNANINAGGIFSRRTNY
jgi:hypothetical protein